MTKKKYTLESYKALCEQVKKEIKSDELDIDTKDVAENMLMGNIALQSFMIKEFKILNCIDRLADDIY